jgi:hypothetical protein
VVRNLVIVPGHGLSTMQSTLVPAFPSWSAVAVARLLN